MSPGDGTIDLPLAAVGNNGACEKVDHATRQRRHDRAVARRRSADRVARRRPRRQRLARRGHRADDVSVLNNVNLGTNTQTLSIGTSGTTTPANDQHRRQHGHRRRRRRDVAELHLAAPVVLALAEADARLQGRAGPAEGQALPLQRPPDVRHQRQAQVGAEAHAGRHPQQGRQEEPREGRHHRRGQRQAHGHPGLPELAHDHLPLHQQRRYSVRGEHQGAGRQKKKKKS